MKKLIKTFLLFTIMFFGINKVNADRSCEDLVMYAQSDFKTDSNVRIKYTGSNYKYSLFRLKDSSGSAFASYCRNAGYNAGQSYNGQKYECKAVVFDPTSTNEQRKAYDAGIIEILKNGYSEKNTTKYPLIDDQEYAATSLAIRTYEMLWDDININAAANNNSNKSNRYYANKWLDDPEMKPLIMEATGKLRDKLDSISVTSWTNAKTGEDITDKIVGEARSLVIKGLKAAIKHKKEGAATITWNENPIKSKSPVVEDENGIKTYKMNLTYNFTAEKFKTKDAYIYIDFICEDCEKYGLDYNVFINDENIGKVTTKNLIELLTNGNGKFSVKIEFTGTSEDYSCEEIKYKLNLRYYDETINTEAYDMYSTACSSSSKCQHFYMLYADEVEQKDTIENSIELCSITCNDLKNDCESGNTTACAKFEEKYHSTCASCGTYISDAQCSNEKPNLEIKEGYEIDSSTCNASAEPNVLQCVIDNEDAAGNSYKNINAVSNNYCSVWCKEDYDFVMPGIKSTFSGRAFSLETSVKGTKTCYTTKIDKDEFEDDYKDANKSVINAYNEYAIFDAAVNNSPSPKILHEPTKVQAGEKKECTKTLDKCIYELFSEGKSNKFVQIHCGTGIDINGIKCSEYITELNYRTEYTTIYKYTWNYKVSGTHEYNQNNTVCKNGTCEYRGAEKLEEYYNATTLKQKVSTLDSKIKKVNNVVSNYNACSNWTMDYEFEPEISFWYQEMSNPNFNINTNLLETVGSVNKTEVKTETCSTNTNNSYESCDSGWKDNEQYKTKSVMTCYKDADNSYKCGNKEITINNSVWIKKSITANANYITPTQFYNVYPTGTIALANKDSIKNGSALNNKLPVGLGTKQGVYNYTLSVSNLGEYYFNDNLGRIWGNNKSTVSTTLKENNSCTQNNALRNDINIDGEYFESAYVCSYKVNCPDCPVECDPGGCVNPTCPENNCPVVCESCIFTNNNSNINYRPINPDDINPNDRDLGKNWAHDESISTALEMKAYVTTQEIKESGESIYDINYDSIDEEFAMKVTLDSKMISKIRAYNKSQEDKGGYLNNTLECYNHENNGTTYNNIYCYSTFLDDLLTDDDTKDNIKITSGKTRYLSKEDRENQTQWSGYWTTWSESDLTKWTVTTEHGLSYYKNKYEEIGIGPAWK